MSKQPKRIKYATRLDRYNAYHKRARRRGRQWAEPKAHKLWSGIPQAALS